MDLARLTSVGTAIFNPGGQSSGQTVRSAAEKHQLLSTWRLLGQAGLKAVAAIAPPY